MMIINTRRAPAQPRSGHGRRGTFVVAAVVAFGALPLLAASAAVAADTSALNGRGEITMVHAVPGLVANVYIDGKQVLTGFTASKVTEPVTLSAGSHTVALTSDSGESAGKTVLTATLEITPGATETAVVGLTPSGSAKAFIFPEMPISVPNGQSVVVVRNVAATGPVKLVVDGAPLPGMLAGGATATTDTTAGTHRVVVESATGAIVLPAQSPTLQADRVTTLYLTGSQKDKTLAWVATTRLVSSLTSLSAIPTGDGSTVHALMTVRTDVPAGTAAAIAAAMGAGAYALSRRRARTRANA